MSWEYIKLSGFNLELPFHPDLLSNIALGLFCGAILSFGGYKLAGGKGALILLLAGVCLFAYWKNVLPI